ncbi:hypothetical protein DMUE_3969 [Dictyocoela muelleri]|nr:hypothetical protein DMUE_3969 [Dictyocoela muelleri]
MLKSLITRFLDEFNKVKMQIIHGIVQFIQNPETLNEENDLIDHENGVNFIKELLTTKPIYNSYNELKLVLEEICDQNFYYEKNAKELETDILTKIKFDIDDEIKDVKKIIKKQDRLIRKLEDNKIVKKGKLFDKKNLIKRTQQID